MKIQSRFALVVAIAGIIVVLFAFYQWCHFFPSITWRGKYKDPSQFYFGLIVGVGAIIYARDVWNRARGYSEQKEFEKEHLNQHKDIAERFEKFNEQYREIQRIEAEVRLALLEAQSGD